MGLSLGADEIAYKGRCSVALFGAGQSHPILSWNTRRAPPEQYGNMREWAVHYRVKIICMTRPHGSIAVGSKSHRSGGNTGSEWAALDAEDGSEHGIGRPVLLLSCRHFGDDVRTRFQFPFPACVSYLRSRSNIVRL